MNLDIKTAVMAFVGLLIVGVIMSFYLGIRAIRSGEKLQFFRKKRERISNGWKLLFFALFLTIGAVSTSIYAERTIYQVFPPSPTITLTPTITITHTITVTPTKTLTPTITFTPSISNTPNLPPRIITQITSVITPNPAAVFSPLVFALGIDKNRQPQRAGTEFVNPLARIYGTFSYDKMLEGSQWTALWYRLVDRELICFETKPWDGGTGGYGYTECNAPASLWLPGDYEVEMYLGTTWKRSGQFTISGNPPKPSPTATPTRSITPSRTVTSTSTPSRTPTPSSTTTQPPTQSATLTQSSVSSQSQPIPQDAG
jgi:hypothetical protein